MWSIHLYPAPKSLLPEEEEFGEFDPEHLVGARSARLISPNF